MPVSPDVMEIVRVLNEEGFALLASELLGEVARGREMDSDAGDADLENEEIAEPVKPPLVHLDDGTTPVQRYFDAVGGEGDPPPHYENIPERDQLTFAMEFLRLRLVEPMKHLAEAERLAGELTGPPEEVSAAYLPEQVPDERSPFESPPAEKVPEEKALTYKAIRISFAFDPAPDEPFPGETRTAGLSAEADDLAEVLQRISKVGS